MSASELLVQARIGKRRLAELPPAVRPGSVDEAYVCQDGVVAGWLAHYGGAVAGYKVACTNVIAQQQLGVDGPFYGRLLSPFCWHSGVRLAADGFFMRVIEAEFGFRMGADLAPVAGGRSREEIAVAVEGLLPAIEIVDSRFDDWEHVGAVSLVSDNACNGGWVRGELIRDWRGADLAAQQVQVRVNGAVAREGSGAAVLGHPLNALQWLVNKVNSRGETVRAGQYMTTGVVSAVYMAEAGDEIEADFGSLGTVAVAFTGSDEPSTR